MLLSVDFQRMICGAMSLQPKRHGIQNLKLFVHKKKNDRLVLERVGSAPESKGTGREVARALSTGVLTRAS